MNYLRLLQTRRMAADGTGGGASGAGGADGQSGTGNAGSQGANANDGAEDGDDGDANKGKDGKTFTQAELDAIIAKRLAKVQKEMESKLAAAIAEGERRGKMTAEERAEAERQARQKELEERERSIQMRELRASALETLAEKGLPKELAESLNYTNEETLEKSITAMEKAFRAAVQAGVKERMAGNGAPSAGAPTTEEAYLAQVRAAAGLPPVKK